MRFRPDLRDPFALSEDKKLLAFRNDDLHNGTLRKIFEVFWLPVLLAMLTLAFLGYVFNVWPAHKPPGHRLERAVRIPTVTGMLDGSRAVVFDTAKESCEPADIPDVMARAFRDYKGTVHLVASHSVLRQSLGSTLLNAKHSCQVVYRSVHDPDPAHHDDSAWLDSFYTQDGKKIVALAHMEYHGGEHPGMCHSKNVMTCEFDADTFYLSEDGGYHFKPFETPGNYLGIPYQYQIDRGPSGYSVDTNIVKVGEWYYAMATAWPWPPNCTAEEGPQHCLVPDGAAPIRTSNLLDASSWRGWNGTDFSVSFVDPYLGPVEHPQDHVYTPVPYMDAVSGINTYEPAQLIVATLWSGDKRFGPEGLYLSTSTDLIHWSQPRLVVTRAQMLAKEPAGGWSYAYFSLLDPTSKDLNFSTMGDHPYLYYVRMDSNQSPEGRVLFRQGISLVLNQ